MRRGGAGAGAPDLAAPRCPPDRERLGRAIDVAGLGLRDGSEILVLTGWRSGTMGRRLRQMHDDACGLFKTVLGPESHTCHRDHFHLDMARWRNRAFCR